MSTAIKDREANAGLGQNSSDLVPSSLPIPIDTNAESILASVRETVRHLPPDRVDEIFGDFESAVQSRNLNYLADTIANWVLGGHGYDRMSIRVNNTLDKAIIDRTDPAARASWSEFLALQQSNEGE